MLTKARDIGADGLEGTGCGSRWHVRVRGAEDTATLLSLLFPPQRRVVFATMSSSEAAVSHESSQDDVARTELALLSLGWMALRTPCVALFLEGDIDIRGMYICVCVNCF